MTTTDPEDFWGKAPPKGSQKANQPVASEGLTPDEGFWSKRDSAKQVKAVNEPTAPVVQPDEFWSKAKEHKQAKQVAAATTPEQHRLGRRRKVRRAVLWSAGGLVVVLLILVALAPTIAGSIAPGMIASKASAALTGKVAVASADFSWGGPQRVQGIRLMGRDNTEIARLNIETTAALTGLIFGNLDLGTVTITGGKADIIRNADGTTNIEAALSPTGKKGPQPAPSAAPPSTEEPSLPEGLKAKVLVSNLQVTFTDLSKKAAQPVTVTLKDTDISAVVAPGKALTFDLTADALSGRAVASPTSKTSSASTESDAFAAQSTGKLKVALRVEKWSRADGRLQPKKAEVEAKVSATNLPLALIDAITGPLPQGATLRTGLGETLDLAVNINGSMTDATATIDAAAQNASANADVRIASGQLTSQSPIVLSMKGAAIRSLAPAIDQAIAAQDSARIDTLPDATITIENLNLGLPTDGSAPDFRGGAATITLALSQITGAVRLQAGDQPQPFTIAPMQAKVHTQNLTENVRITAATDATIDGKAAGSLAIDLTLAGLLDAKGGFVQGPPRSIQGNVAVKNIATAIAQPLVAAFNIDLPRDVGPTLDLELTAATDLHNATGASATSVPPTDITVAVRSQNLRASGGIQLTENIIKSRGDGIRLEFASAGAVAQRFLSPESGWQLAPIPGAGAAANSTPNTPSTPGGTAVITITGLNVPRSTTTGAIQIDKAAANASLSLTGLSLRALPREGVRPPASDSIQITTLTLAGSLVPNAPPRIEVASAMKYAGADFGAQGAFDLAGLLTAAADGTVSISPAGIRPIGKLDLRNIPTSIARLMPQSLPAPTSPTAAGASKPEQAPLDLAALLSDVVGPDLSITIDSKAATATPDGLDIAFSAKAQRLTAELSADITGDQLSLRTATAQTTLTPQTVSGLLTAFAPDIKGAPRLAGPSKMTVRLAPITIPLGAGMSPQLSRAGTAAFTLSAPGRTVVDGLVVRNKDGSQRELGIIGIENLELGAQAPLAALVAKALPEERFITATISGVVLGPQESEVLVLIGDLRAEVSEGQLAGPVSANAKLTGINTRTVETLAGHTGLISGAVGDRASIDLSLTVTPPASAAPGAPFAADLAAIDVQATIAAPRLTSQGPMKLAIRPDRMLLVDPVKLSMEVDPDWANQFLTPQPQAGKPVDPKATLKLTQPSMLVITLSKFSVPRAAPAAFAATPGPIPPPEALFNLSLSNLDLQTGEGQAVRLSQTELSVETYRESGSPPTTPPDINFRLDVADAKVGDQPPVSGMTISGSVRDLISPSAGLTPQRALLTMSGDLPAVPTALVDALANQNGMLVEGLGPVIELRLRLERVPLQGGDPLHTQGPPPIVDLVASSGRARTTLRGTVRDGVFVSEAPVNITVTELTQKMAGHFVQGLPIIGSLEKKSGDFPATLVATGVTAPLGNDFSKLNADINIDPGEARFGTSSVFGSLLKAIKATTEGTVGQRLQPLHINIKDGVATYDRWELPLGEFKVQTEGTVDLVKKTLDVVTYIPFGALTDEAAGKFNLGLGSLLGNLMPKVIEAAAMVPFRTKGTLDKHTTSPDLALFAKNFVSTLNPANLIRQGAGEVPVKK